jgi:two-component system KDP operon response regulator KdpE
MNAPQSATPVYPAEAHSPLVLIIEDEAPIRHFLRITLEGNGFRIREAPTARDGILQAVTQRPDLILLDLGLPDGDGLEVTRTVRTESAVPIIVLSARGLESDKIAALDAGADDYLTKPFGVGELLARIRVAMRHSALSQANASTRYQVYEATAGSRTLQIDPVGRLVHVMDGKVRREVRLTPTEFKLLAFLVKHAGKVLVHRFILKEVWGVQHQGDVQYLRVYAGELRKKFEIDPAQPQFLLTESGVGYRLIEPTGSDSEPGR